jgi:hypothetical protein
MKKIIIAVALSFVWLISFATFIYAQNPTNDSLITKIDAVLASNKSGAVKKALATQFVTILNSVYVANINATGDAADIKVAEIGIVAGMILAYNNTIAGIPATGVNVPPPPPPPAQATFLETPQLGGTKVKAKGDAGKEYQVSVNGEDAGNAVGEADGSFIKKVPELQAGSKVTIKPVADGKPIDGRAVSEEAVGYDDPTKGGIFGVLVGGAVFSQQNQNYGQSSPFFGFNTGYYSKAYGTKRYMGTTTEAVPKNIYLTMTTSRDYLTDTEGRVWMRDYAANGLTFKNGTKVLTLNNSNAALKNGLPVIHNGAMKLKKGSFFKEFRLNFRFQGIFESDGRTATGKEDAATPSASPTPTPSATPAATPNNPFQFIASQQTFTTQGEAWMEFRPLRQFSFGPYVSIGASTLIDKSNAEAGTKFVSDNGKSSTIVKQDTDLKKFYDIGAIFNLRFPDQKFFLQAIFARGYYEQYKDLDLNPLKLGDAGYNPLFKVDNTTKRFVGKLRVFPEGLNATFGRQIDITPMFGVDLNAGNGPDNLRFFTGFAIRLRKIGIADAAK